MDSFVSSTKPKPALIYESSTIKDKDSNFVAAIYLATNPSEAQAAIRHHRLVVHGPKKASHEIAAWRYMAVKSGRSGVNGPGDFEVKGNYDDDGEKGGGGRILKVMQGQGVIDAIVIVSRWFGGTLLGPARFTHIETCAMEVCTKFKNKELVEEYIGQLKELDDEVAKLRKSLASSADNDDNNNTEQSGESSTRSTKLPNYDQLIDSLDVEKAKRLVAARGRAVSALRKLQDERNVTEPIGLL